MARATDVDDGAAPLPPPPEPPPTERSRPPPPALEGSPAIVLPARSPDCGGSRDPESTAQIGGFLHPAKWRILFEDVRAIGLRSEGVLFTYYPSRWMVVRDLDNDILGGRYLNEEEEISEGYFPSYSIDLFVVATHSDGGQGAFGYWIYPLGDGSSGYLQPVWMAVM
ncbi:uncharacterized protein [Triticum aestivum]|uniref:uncharacterized protein isoform X2 n=1 Tax=Triticum aestivum TaxID=4565 RepID=UPI001D034AEB|nr:uncharacterized protein LOC123087689 isoform X2 [Triticum aestivum]